MSVQTGNKILKHPYTGNEYRKRKFCMVILSFLTRYIPSAGQMTDITCRFRIISTLGSVEPARIVGGQLLRIVTADVKLEFRNNLLFLVPEFVF